MWFFLYYIPQSLQICHTFLYFQWHNNPVLMRIPWIYTTYFPVLQTLLSFFMYMYQSLLQKYFLCPFILVLSLWGLGCSKLKGGVCVYLRCRNKLSPPFTLTNNMPSFSIFPHFSPFLDYLTHCLAIMCPTISMCFLLCVFPVRILLLSGLSLFLFVLDIDHHIVPVSDILIT